MTTTRRPGPTPEQRHQRHESRTGSTYKAFLRHLAAVSGMSEDQAERAAVAVLCALEQRLFAGEARHLEAQLPSKLRELIHRCPLHAGSAPHRFGREEFFRIVAEDFGPTDDLERIARTVIGAVRDQISPGEAEDVASQLPHDLRELWQTAAPAAAHP